MNLIISSLIASAHIHNCPWWKQWLRICKQETILDKVTKVFRDIIHWLESAVTILVNSVEEFFDWLQLHPLALVILLILLGLYIWQQYSDFLEQKQNAANEKEKKEAEYQMLKDVAVPIFGGIIVLVRLLLPFLGI